MSSQKFTNALLAGILLALITLAWQMHVSNTYLIEIYDISGTVTDIESIADSIRDEAEYIRMFSETTANAVQR